MLLFLLGALLWWSVQPPRLEVPRRRELVFADVTVVNPGEERSPGRTVVVRGERIARVTDFEPGDARRGEEERFRGAYVLPGLVDVHVHLPPAIAVGQLELFSLLFLAHGVTAIRETGSFGGASFEIRRRIRDGELAGPRIFSCGPFLDGDPPVWPVARIVRDGAEARAAVEDLAASGADCVKVYSQMSADALAGVHEAAARFGLPVIGHLPVAVPFSDTRVAEIQHVCDPRCGELDLDRVEEIVRTAVDANLAHTPTLVVYAQQKGRDEYPQQMREPAAQLLPRFWREVIWNPEYELGYDSREVEARPGYAERHAAMVAMIRTTVRRLHEEGVTVLVGTDPINPFVVPGASLHRELELLVEVGFTSDEAWRAATRRAGEALGEPGLGRVREGAPADLLVFERDPTRDLGALATLTAVVANGRFYSKEELDRVVASQLDHFDRPLYRTLSMFLARRAARWISGADE